MRSTLGGHFAGTGMRLAFVEEEEMYTNEKVDVRLPSDRLKGDKLKELSGPITTYNIYSGGSTHVRTYSN